MDKPLMSNYSSPTQGGTGTKSHSSTGRCRVSDLPDLTDKLKEQGIYAEYIEWRDNYMKWRKGEASGAKGENTIQEQGIYAEYIEWRDNYMKWRKGEASGAKGENTIQAHLNRGTEFEHWYPTVKTFNFRRTLAFWTGVMTCEGCLLFLWTSYTAMYYSESPLVQYIVKVPTLYGGTAFLVGIYLTYFELINMNSDVDAKEINYLWCDWKALTSIGIEVASIMGSLMYLVGALLYTVSQVSDCFFVEGELREYLFDWPLIVGGFLFFTGGLCELKVNNVFCTPPTSLVWWAAVLNTFGGLCFWLAVCPRVVPPAQSMDVFIVGSALYLVSANFLLLMWRGEQFGGTLIPAINKAQRDTGGAIVVRNDPTTGVSHIVTGMGKEHENALENVLHPKLSWRGLFFLNVYTFIASVQTVACFLHLSEVQTVFFQNRSGPAVRQFVNIVISEICWIVMAHMVLVFNSASVRMPSRDQQPYHALLVWMRIISIVVLMNSLLFVMCFFDAAGHVTKLARSVVQPPHGKAFPALLI
eukprot:TRINITY_DN10748_c0_g1_i1.p1 TRINITY_DN10748_c0_g1~~TRINITY_DN10748_c0_g1_i1.p1  ORF type:complete len:528 (+),score=84.99 TRINITY_DN10748_c0_g1_i1:68-1651(+)